MYKVGRNTDHVLLVFPVGYHRYPAVWGYSDCGFLLLFTTSRVLWIEETHRPTHGHQVCTRISHLHALLMCVYTSYGPSTAVPDPGIKLTLEQRLCFLKMCMNIVLTWPCLNIKFL